MLPWQPAIVHCVMFDAMLLSDLANKFSLSLSHPMGTCRYWPLDTFWEFCWE